MKLGHAIANFFSGLWSTELEPWVKTLLHTVLHDVVTALIPLAQDAIQELLAGGQGVTLASVGAATAKKAAALGMSIAEHDLGLAVSGALALHAAAQGS